MTRPRAPRRVAARALALLMGCAIPLTSGCARADGLAGLFSTPKPAVSATPTPSPSPAPEVSATPFSVNPLYDFYRDFAGGSRSCSLALSRALYGRNSADALALSLALSAHLVALSGIGASVCRLFASADGRGYSGTVSGAAEGSGGMSPAQDGAYAFTFNYSGGDMLMGTFRPEARVDFSTGEYEVKTDGGQAGSLDPGATPAPYEEPVFLAERVCAIEKTAEGWTSTVEENGVISIFSISGGAIEFSAGGIVARLAGETLSLGPAGAVTEATAAP